MLKTRISQIDTTFIEDWDYIIKDISKQLKNYSSKSQSRDEKQLQHLMNDVVYYKMHIDPERQKCTTTHTQFSSSMRHATVDPSLSTALKHQQCSGISQQFLTLWNPVYEHSIRLYENLLKLRKLLNSLAVDRYYPAFLNLLSLNYYKLADTTYLPLILANITQYNAGMTVLIENVNSLQQSSQTNKNLIDVENDHPIVRFHL
ncbi:MAG: hypothetical protein P4M12_08720 [Gammaproteobacteria bacterium]|nr:hypothetical protein [Gammaproteobacteria bacterium]